MIWFQMCSFIADSFSALDEVNDILDEWFAGDNGGASDDNEDDEEEEARFVGAI